MQIIKRIAKYLHAAMVVRNPAGNVSLSLLNSFTTTTEYFEFVAGQIGGTNGARIRLYRPTATTDKALELLSGTTVIAVLRRDGSVSLGGNYFSLSPVPTGTTPHVFLRPHLAVVNTGGGSLTEAIAYNSYLDGGNSRAVFAGIGIKIFFSAASSALIISTAPSVSAGVVQTFTQRFAFPVAGRQWANVTGSRSIGTVFQNTSGGEREVSASVGVDATGRAILEIDTVNPPAIEIGRAFGGIASEHQLAGLVPNNGFYRIRQANATVTLLSWAEL